MPSIGYHKSVPAFHVENFGCRATQADGAAIERQFRNLGMEPARAQDDADIIVLNTCTVTAAADQDARAAIRRIHRQNPDCKIVVTGCYAQRAPAEIAALPGVSQVIGNSHKHTLAQIALPLVDKSGKGPTSVVPKTSSHERALAPECSSAFFPLTSLITNQRRTYVDHPQIFVSDIFAHTELLGAPVFDAAGQRTRPNLKVQDGCDNRCSFCVIPSVRGQSRSLPLERILREVDGLISAGYREVVISGINLGRWGRDFPSANGQGQRTNGQRPDRRLTFETLVRAILTDTTLEKLRISSVEPMDWSGELIQLMAESSRIAKHAHLPMQSGSDAVLRRMHRKYRPWHYREKIEQIRAAMPTAAIGADVMVGFPGETEVEFEATRRMIEELPFTYLHVFTYSSRPGTPSATMHGQVPVHIARERNRVLRELVNEKKLAFMRGFVGKTIQAITLNIPTKSLASRVEQRDSPSEAQCGVEESEVFPDPTFTEALTDNYLKLHLQGSHAPNCWLSTKVSGMQDGALIGSDTT